MTTIRRLWHDAPGFCMTITVTAAATVALLAWWLTHADVTCIYAMLAWLAVVWMGWCVGMLWMGG